MILFEKHLKEIEDHPESLYHNTKLIQYLKSERGKWAIDLIIQKYGKEWVLPLIDTMDAYDAKLFYQHTGKAMPTDPSTFVKWYFQNKYDEEDFQEMKNDFGMKQEKSSGGGGNVQGTLGSFDDESLIREAGGSNVDFILKMIRKFRDQDPNNPDRLLSIRDIRSIVSKGRPNISKEEFDDIILAFSKRGIVKLHHHDHPSGVSQQERDAMVRTPEYIDPIEKRKTRTYFIGLTLEEPQQTFEIDRHQFFEELMLREKIKQEIVQSYQEKQKNFLSMIQEEMILRREIRKILLEKEKQEIKPHSSTGINVLEDLLKTIIPQIEQDYKTLTTSPEQRESYKAHILKAIQQTLIRGDINDDATQQEQKINEAILIEWVNSLAMLSDADINIGIDQPSQPGDGQKFIDIDGDGKPDEEPEDTFGIVGQNETGRNMAEETFDKIEKQILDSYMILSDPEDQKLFFDYLLTNLKLYLTRFDDEMDLSTDEPMTNPETEMGSEPSSDLPL